MKLFLHSVSTAFPDGVMLPRPVSGFRAGSFRSVLAVVVFALFVLPLLSVIPAAAQNPPPPPPPPAQAAPEPGPGPAPGPPLNSKQLDQLVARVALYPDPLLVQVLTASTFSQEIPEATGWANEHGNLKGDALANAIREDNLQWDASVLALLPFPSVLNMMAQDPAWTEQLGNAVLTQRPEVMDAVQHERKQARKYGYLQPSPYCNVVETGGYVEVVPVNPAYIYVPVYDPLIVFGPPRPGFVVGAAIGWSPAIVIGVGFAPWGWGHAYFGWGAHSIMIDETPWNRGWVNRGYYVHPYRTPWVRGAGPRVEMHRGRPR